MPECWYWIRKLQARFFAGDYSSAIQASLNAVRLLWTQHSYLEVAEYHFYSALARAGAFDSATESSRQEHFKALADHHRQLAIWAENCRENFENRDALVGAEIARIEGREALLASAYAIFLILLAFALEKVARHSHHRAERTRLAGFKYHPDHDIWECPSGERLMRVAFAGHGIFAFGYYLRRRAALFGFFCFARERAPKQ